MLDRLMDGSLMPHGHCLMWREDLLFLHLGGDILTSLSYALIPVLLIYIVRMRKDLHYGWMFWLFSGFIFFCGLTHFIGIINIWNGYYFIEGLAKITTGVISAITAIMLLKLVPAIRRIPSALELEQQNYELNAIKNQLMNTNKTLEERVKRRTNELEKLASTDSLTGVLNRGEIIRIGHNEFARSIRYQRPFSVIMLDIDFFKIINDQKGHQAGDEALKAVSNVVAACCRESDYLGRYGGEEFIIICPETDAEAGQKLAERCRLSIASIPHEPAITVSIGVAEVSKETGLEDVISNADAALYQAKEHGRNQVNIYTG